MADAHATLDAFFPAMFADDSEVLRELLTEDAEWHAPPFAERTFGELKGREAIVSFLTGAGDSFYESGSFEMEPILRAIEGDEAIVMARLRARTARGNPYENRYAFGFRLRGGLICEAWELLDSLHFQAQQSVR